MATPLALSQRRAVPQYHIMGAHERLVGQPAYTTGHVWLCSAPGTYRSDRVPHPRRLRSKQGIHATQERLLNDLIGKYRDFKDYYLVKKSGLDKIRAMIADPNEVVKAVLDVEYALNTVEKELATHQGGKEPRFI
ncbi:hypothetical protein JTE90_001026 [Oedothorax gibbosus]|uniref:Uncharacterized protein n=1 Tax=Oedothorax gibbosus TaxID=931172 RepID=A0AAV6TQ32_9ARAC|nr:hypothetical protein JTE90_001026 [Oedothorax gibbosus]